MGNKSSMSIVSWVQKSLAWAAKLPENSKAGCKMLVEKLKHRVYLSIYKQIFVKRKKGIYVGGKFMPKRGVSKQNLYIKGKKLDALKGWLPVKK